eukprot:2955217-Rhodomonas_salina.1
MGCHGGPGGLCSHELNSCLANRRAEGMQGQRKERHGPDMMMRAGGHGAGGGGFPAGSILAGSGGEFLRGDIQAENAWSGVRVGQGLCIL